MKVPISEEAVHAMAVEAIREAKRRRNRERIRKAGEVRFTDFQLRYFNDPAGFINECIKWDTGRRATDYQLDMSRDLVTYHRESERGPRGLGKTASVSWLVHWYALTRDGLDWKIPTTASSWPQLTKFLWPEIHKWARCLNWDIIGRRPYERDELLMLNLRLKTGEAFAITSENADLIEGAHADYMFFIFDESKSIPDSIFDSAEGSLSGGTDVKEALALAVSTPGQPLGRFFDIQSGKAGYRDWHVRKVTKEEAILAGRISQDWVDKRALQWGTHSALYINHVEGDFAAEESNGVIPISYVEAAFQNWYAWEAAGFPGAFTGVGVDVGGGGEENDKSILALAYDLLKIRELRKYDRADPETATMELAGNVVAILRKLGGEALVDTIGIGAGTAHRIAELGYRVRHFVASASTELRDSSGEYGFTNWRSAGWWLMRELMDPLNKFYPCLPPDEDLLGELTAPHYKTTSNGEIQVEGKEIIRRTLHRSTDSADAVMHILIGPILCDERIKKNGVVGEHHEQIGPNY